MVNGYRAIHISFKSLGQEAKDLADGYVNRTVSNETFQEVLTQWDRTCPNILYENGNKLMLSTGLIRLIGKRRALLLSAALRIFRMNDSLEDVANAQ